MDTSSVIKTKRVVTSGWVKTHNDQVKRPSRLAGEGRA